MATETPTQVQYRLQLENGYTQTGKLKTVNLNLGKMSLVGFQLDRAAALSESLMGILDRNVHGEYMIQSATVTPV